MADFRLTDEQRQYQQLARQFAQNEIVPRAAHYDVTGEFPGQIYEQAWQLGLMNVHIPEKLGGFGLGVFDACLINEEIGAACTGVGAAMDATNLAQTVLILSSSEEQQQEFLTPLVEECSYAAYCTFDGTRKTAALRTGSDFVISGEKLAVTNAGVARWFLVLAAVEGDKDEPALSAFIVPRDSQGVVVGERQTALGQRCCDRRPVSFRDVRVPIRYLVGQSGQGRLAFEQALSRWRPLTAASAVGLARSGLEHSIRYSRERTTFGRPISDHQAVAFMLADMAKDIEAARLLAWQAAWLADHNRDNGREATVARAFAVDTAMRVATDAVQVFGGYGYTREYPVEKLMRDAKVLQLLEESSQKERVALGRQLVGAST
jgi:acyl-CoA dehydrogenase